MYDNTYIFIGTDANTGEIYLINFNPDSKQFSRIVLDKPITVMQDFSIAAFTLSKNRDLLYLIASSYNDLESRACLYTINLKTKKFYEPTTFYTLPTQYIVGTCSMDIDGNGNILVAGGSMANNWYYNFYPVVYTLLITPEITKVETVNNNIPTDFSLSQNYPNPFNPSTKIAFSINKEGLVNLKVYDLLGKEVATLVNEELAAGNYEVTFNTQSEGLNLASGMYIYKLTSNGATLTKKMLLQK